MRFIGSKTKLLPYIDLVFDKHGINWKNLRFWDAFAGTATVSWHARRRGAIVTASDLLFFSYLRQVAILTLPCPPAFEGIAEDLDGYEDVLQYLLHVRGRTGCITDVYTRPPGGDGLNFFSESVGRWADGVLSKVRRMAAQGRLTWPETAALISTIIETLDVAANTTGVYAACLKGRPRVREITFAKGVWEWRGPVGHAYHADAVDIAPRLRVDIAYLDPPYNQRQYSGYYHIPEVVARMALMDPEEVAESLVNTTAMLPWKPLSAFSSRRQVRHAFGDLLRRLRCPYALLSYNDEGLLEIDVVIDLFKRVGWKTTVYSIPHRSYKSNDARERDMVTEYLVFAENARRPGRTWS